MILLLIPTFRKKYFVFVKKYKVPLKVKKFTTKPKCCLQKPPTNTTLTSNVSRPKTKLLFKYSVIDSHSA